MSRYIIYPNMLLLIVLLSVVLNATTSTAQQKQTEHRLTLQQCLEFATLNNVEIKNARLDVDRAKQNTNIYLSNIFPTVALNVDYRYNTEIPVTLLPASALGGPANTYRELRFGVVQSLNTGIAVDQVLYNHAAFIALKAIKPIRQQSQLYLEETKETVLYNVSATFYNIQIAEMQEKMLSSNVSSLDKTLNLVKTLISQELIPSHDGVKLKIQQERIKAQHIELMSNLQKMYNMLKLLIGIPISDRLEIVQETEEHLKAFFVSAVTDIPSVSSLRQTKINEISVDLLKVEREAALSTFMPSIFLRANYNIAGNNDQFNPFQTIQDRWFTSSYISLGIKIPLFDGLESIYTRKMKDIEYAQAKNKFENFKIDMQRKIVDASNDYQTKKEMEITRKDIYENQQQLMQAESTQYELGLSPLTSFLRAQDDLLIAQTEYIRSLVELKKSELEYKKLTNTSP